MLFFIILPFEPELFLVKTFQTLSFLALRVRIERGPGKRAREGQERGTGEKARRVEPGEKARKEGQERGPGEGQERGPGERARTEGQERGPGQRARREGQEGGPGERARRGVFFVCS